MTQLWEKTVHILANNIIMNNPYEIIFDALIKEGYSEAEAEEIICVVIEEQRYLDDYARNVHKALEKGRLVSWKCPILFCIRIVSKTTWHNGANNTMFVVCSDQLSQNLRQFKSANNTMFVVCSDPECSDLVFSLAKVIITFIFFMTQM